ncbi:DUF2189 domain-containing protein [Flavobacterium collinsii]|uniref:Beta-carotene 15,15'-monooxygenase n=1 Tax=Flavobacterium collinsii TaxID=1114861 RepID=A0ABN7EGC0_9FLAO|nr:hypothetical protein [Flavobacterium collinsii]CAA9196132.1 hypothetical protein FLACOL7796_00990 [Flavobacterium collinsii]
MKSTSDQIKDIKNHGYTLDFSTVFNHAFENYKKIAVYAGLMLLVFSVFFGAIAYLILVTAFGIDKLTNANFLNIQPQNLSQIQLVLYIVGTAFASAIMGPFTAGFLKMADCAEKDVEFNVSTIFSYYKSSHFSQIFVATFLISLFSVVTTTFLEILKLNAVGFVFSLLLSFFTFLTIPLIVFGNLKAVEAIKSSFIVITKQPMVLIGLIITILGAILVGFCAFCIGVLFTIPFSYSMTYAIYCSIFNIDKQDPIDSIGQSDF